MSRTRSVALDTLVELLVRPTSGYYMKPVPQCIADAGSSVSAAFLFIVGLANSVILHRVLRKRRQVRRVKSSGDDGNRLSND
jgi:high-affinity nickel permease